jgi:hypothetical protein
VDAQTGGTVPGATAPGSQLTAAQIQQLQAQDRLVRQFRNGASWFYWIAGLSVVNSLIWWIGGGWSFLAGLAFTQIADGFLSGLGQELGGSGGIAAAVVALTTSLIVAGIFCLFGYLAHKGNTWTFYVGMGIYALDALIFLAFGEFLSFGFHLFALFGLYRGLRALGKLRTSAVAPAV